MSSELKFREILKHAWNNSSLYREIYKDAGIRETDLDDISLEDLPVVSKKDVMQRFDEAVTDPRLKIADLKNFIRSDRDPLNFYLDEYIVVGSSAGSDIASYVPFTIQDWRFVTTIAAQHLLENEINEKETLRSAFYFARPGHWASTTSATLASRAVHNVLKLSVHDPEEEVCARLNAFKPERLSTYGSALFLFVDWTLQGKLDILPKTIVVSGDLLTPKIRSMVDDLWGAKIYDVYASVESLYTAIKKPDKDDYEVLSDLAVVEVVDDDNKMVQYGEIGRILITNLVQRTIPFIRFDQWDYATLGSSNFGADKLIGLEGKSFDNLPVRSIDGGIVDIPVYKLSNLQIPHVKRFQFTSYNPDHIEIKYISNEIADNYVESAIRNLVGDNYKAIKQLEINRVDYFNAFGNGTKFYFVMKPDSRRVIIKTLKDEVYPIRRNRSNTTTFGTKKVSRIDFSKSIQENFKLVADENGGILAINDKADHLNFSELDSKSDNIARHLIQNSFDPNHPVVLLFDHKPVVALAALGVLKAGGFYLPLDLNLPEQRILSVIKELQPDILITDKKTIEFESNLLNVGVKVINLEELLNEDHTPMLLPEVSPLQPAVVIFTSGTTGKSKGIVLNHKTILIRAERYIKDFKISSRDKLSFIQSFAVSAGIREIFGGLLSGATLEMFDLQTQGLNTLGQWINETQITHLYTVPTLWKLFLETLSDEDFRSIKFVRLGGEPALKTDFEGFQKHLPEGSYFVNAYAATELGTISQLYLDHDSELIADVISVGYPVDGVQIKLEDDSGREVKKALGGVSVAGNSTAAGYWDSDLSQIVPFKEEYQDSGDLGYWLDDGRMILTGRRDRIVKIHGYRINLSEIEESVANFNEIIDSAAVPETHQGGETSIKFFYATKTGHPIPIEDIRQKFQSVLPRSAIPSSFVHLPSLPRMPGGKINIYSLLSQETTAQVVEKVDQDYKNAVESALADIWKEYLGTQKISRDDDFFLLGGDSVTVFRVQNRIWKDFQVEITVFEFFEYTTLSSMADLILQKLNKNAKT